MNTGICPVCNGSSKVPLTADEKRYSWYKDKTNRDCTNCGGQTMFGRATGKVPLRPDGTPCRHEYTSATVGRCLTRYTCRHCGSSHEIDSGD